MNIQIISGGQTGVDRAALDVALRLGLQCGGWCPKGRRAEDGRIPDAYPLKETSSSSYSQRTEWNVRDSDGTLILYRDAIFGGTALTVDWTVHYQKPCLRIRLGGPEAAVKIQSWLVETEIRSLNVAGPRESEDRGIHMDALGLLATVLAAR